MLNATHASAPGSASAPSQIAYCRHAVSATRQRPVIPSTHRGTTNEKPATTSTSRSQEGIH